MQFNFDTFLVVWCAIAYDSMINFIKSKFMKQCDLSGKRGGKHGITHAREADGVHRITVRLKMTHFKHYVQCTT